MSVQRIERATTAMRRAQETANTLAMNIQNLKVIRKVFDYVA